MPTETGTVIKKTTPGRALIRTQRGSACASCQARGACQALVDGEAIAEVEVLDPLGAKEDDRVEIFLSDAFFLKLSLITYLFPTLALLAGAVAGFYFARFYGWNENLAGPLSGLASLGIAIVLVWLWTRRRAHDRRYIPEIVRILNHP